MTMTTSTARLAKTTVTRSADLDRQLLVAAGLEHEPIVILEPTVDGLTVRKLTAAEKIAYSAQSDEPAFAGTDAELVELFDAVPAADDAA